MKGRQRLINPVLEKEFLLRMRTVRSSWSVLLYVSAIGLLAIGFIYMEMIGRGTAGFNPNNSRELFYFLSITQLVLITFTTPGLTAGMISGEREKQTLNMLLTTQQSSSAIILSKLLASLGFMLLLVVATLPVYGIVFLYGGISPAQLAAVFGFYVFTMLVLGSVGALCSTLFRRTVAAVVVTYGFALAINGLTFLAAVFFAETWARNSAIPGYVMGFNPVGALISLLDPNFSADVFSRKSSLQLWQLYYPIYGVVSCLCLWLSISFLRPRLGKRKKSGQEAEHE